MPKKVLLVTEGPGDKKVLSNLFRTFSLSNIDIVTFKTDIHYLGRLYEAAIPGCEESESEMEAAISILEGCSSRAGYPV